MTLTASNMLYRPDHHWPPRPGRWNPRRQRLARRKLDRRQPKGRCAAPAPSVGWASCLSGSSIPAPRARNTLRPGQHIVSIRVDLHRRPQRYGRRNLQPARRDRQRRPRRRQPRRTDSRLHPAMNDTFTIVSATGTLSGTFAGLPDNTTFACRRDAPRQLHHHGRHLDRRLARNRCDPPTVTAPRPPP